MVKDRQAQTESPSLIYVQERMLNCYSSFLVHMNTKAQSELQRRRAKYRALYTQSARQLCNSLYEYYYSLSRAWESQIVTGFKHRQHEVMPRKHGRSWETLNAHI